MEVFLTYFAIIMLIIVVCLGINEKTFKIPPEIALLAFSLIIGIIFKLSLNADLFESGGTLMETVTTVKIDDILMNALLCFMLFSGASDLKFRSLRKNFKAISLLALVSTVITTVVYGILFYATLKLFGAPAELPFCLLLGAIISPTDPIAATGILNKLGLPEEITAIMEGESLFNDGIGVALYLFTKGIITGTNEAGFFAIMSKELFGAIITGCIISFLCSCLLKITDNQVYHILISMLAVSSCYALCEALGFSGVIASVICGIYFATVMEKMQENNPEYKNDKCYENFWSAADKILNYVLYVFIGLSFIFVVKLDYSVYIVIISIIINLMARYAGVFISTVLLRKRPGGYSVNQFTTLMTWSGLKGGLCLALVMGTISCLETQVYNMMMFVVFTTIIFTTIVQGLTVDKLYLKIDRKVKTREKISACEE